MYVCSRSSVLTGLAIGVLASAVPHAAKAQAARVLRVGAPNSDSFAVPFYIKDAGTFVRLRYDIEALHLSNGAATIAAVSGGSLDLGVSDLIPVMNAINRGVPVALVAGCGLYESSEPTAILAVAKDSSIRVPRDLEGKSIGVPNLAGLSVAALRAWLSDNGVDPAKVKMVEIPTPAAPSMVARGTIESAMVGEPFYSTSKSELRDIGRPLDAIGKEFLFSAWFASLAWIDADRERAKRVVAALHETSRWANAHRAETALILARDFKMEIDQIRGMGRAVYATSLNPVQIQPMINVAEKFKLIEKPIAMGSLVARL
jgi:NitT/TauT family transport system substrate-binding protein